MISAQPGMKRVGRAGRLFPKALATKIHERQERLTELDARIQLRKSAPSVLDLEVRRLENEVRNRLGSLRDAMSGNVDDGRRVLRALLAGGLIMTPQETASGKEYAMTGRVVLGDLLSTAEPDQVSAVSIGGRPRRDSNPC